MPVFEFLFNVQSDVLIHRTVMASDQITEKRPQFLDDGFRHFSSVCKNQRRGVGTDEVGDGFDVVLEEFRHGEVAEFGMGDENVQIQFTRT